MPFTEAKSLQSQWGMLMKSHVLDTWDPGIPAQTVPNLLPRALLASSPVHFPVGNLVTSSSPQGQL